MTKIAVNAAIFIYKITILSFDAHNRAGGRLRGRKLPLLPDARYKTHAGKRRDRYPGHR